MGRSGQCRMGLGRRVSGVQEIRDHYGGGSAIHGAGGEWRVEEQRLRWDILDAWREAAAECGIGKIEDFNGGNNEGSARFQVNQRGAACAGAPSKPFGAHSRAPT